MLEIRKATLDDYEAINILNKEIQNYHREIRPDVFVRTDFDDYDLETFSAEIEDDDKLWVVACEERKVVGAMLTYLKGNSSTGHVYCFIDTLVVTKNCRSKGIGQALFDEAERFARDNNIDTIELGVWEGNPAYDFYKKQGMTTQRTILKKELGKNDELFTKNETENGGNSQER